MGNQRLSTPTAEHQSPQILLFHSHTEVQPITVGVGPSVDCAPAAVDTQVDDRSFYEEVDLERLARPVYCINRE